MTIPAVVPASTGYPCYKVTLDAVPEIVEEARRLTRQALNLWGLDGQADMAALLMSELITNAITHTACRRVSFQVSRPSAARVRLAVVDRAPERLPQLRPAADEAESGRGLRLVDAFADRWGYDLLGSRRQRSPWGKSCWAELCVKQAR